jgi:hypothetical protein
MRPHSAPDPTGARQHNSVDCVDSGDYDADGKKARPYFSEDAVD